MFVRTVFLSASGYTPKGHTENDFLRTDLKCYSILVWLELVKNIGDVIMNKNLLIIGAGCCGLAARETAQAMGCFEKISFLDDNIKEMPDGSKILGAVDDFENFDYVKSKVMLKLINYERNRKFYC